MINSPWLKLGKPFLLKIILLFRRILSNNLWLHCAQVRVLCIVIGGLVLVDTNTPVELEDLNLSGNQIADWTTVTDIIQGCENLRVLNVSGNPLAPESISQFVPPPSLRVLVFQRVNASWDDVSRDLCRPFTI